MTILYTLYDWSVSKAKTWPHYTSLKETLSRKYCCYKLCSWSCLITKPHPASIICSGESLGKRLHLTKQSSFVTLWICSEDLASRWKERCHEAKVTCDWSIQYHPHSTYRGLWGLVVVRLSWLSGRALAAQARGVLGSTPGGCRPFSLSSNI